MNLSTLNNTMKHSVMALIYRSDGRVLLQQRDYTQGIPYPGHWTFFGVQVETGENLKSALQRELIEELGCLPGRVGDELFQWVWQADITFLSHCYPVHCDVGDDSLVLNEGQAMSWFFLEGLRDFSLTPAVSENMGKIAAFLEPRFPTNLVMEKAGDLALLAADNKVIR